MTLISEIIKKRYSCRSYGDDAIAAQVLQEFKEAVGTPARGLFGNEPRFVLISMESLSRGEWKKLGTYGMIKNARLFLAGMVKPAPMATCDYGYCKEKLILKATELGLGSCWLGGTFAISAFGKAAGMSRNELMPTISPIGLPSRHKSLAERVMRGISGSEERLSFAELFFDGRSLAPLTPENAGLYKEALENVRLAPSAVNKQPWRVIRDTAQNTFLFYLSRTFGYKHFRDVSLQEIDMGIAFCHFDLTLQQLGIAGSWRLDKAAPKIKSWEYFATWQAI